MCSPFFSLPCVHMEEQVAPRTEPYCQQNWNPDYHMTEWGRSVCWAQLITALFFLRQRFWSSAASLTVALVRQVAPCWLSNTGHKAHIRRHTHHLPHKTHCRLLYWHTPTASVLCDTHRHIKLKYINAAGFTPTQFAHCIFVHFEMATEGKLALAWSWKIVWKFSLQKKSFSSAKTKTKTKMI